MPFVVKRVFRSKSDILDNMTDYAEIWKSGGHGWPLEKWFDGYVNGNYLHHRTVFDSYDYAHSVAVILSERWLNCEFQIEAVGEDVIMHPLPVR